MLFPSSFRAASTNSYSKTVLYEPDETDHPLTTSPLVAKTLLKNDSTNKGEDADLEKMVIVPA